MRSHGRIITQEKCAHIVGCHPTYISQVMRGISHLSPDQAALLSTHFGHTELESWVFLLMILKERSETIEARQYFQSLLNKVSGRLDPVALFNESHTL